MVSVWSHGRSPIPKVRYLVFISSYGEMPYELSAVDNDEIDDHHQRAQQDGQAKVPRRTEKSKTHPESDQSCEDGRNDVRPKFKPARIRPRACPSTPE